MIIDKAVDVLSKREADGVFGLPGQLAQKIGSAAVSAGAWVYPPYYQKQCEALISRTNMTRRSEECIVTGIGEIVICALQGKLKVDPRTLRKMVDEVKPGLEDVGYDTVFDSYTAEVLEKFAPLHEET